MAAERSPSLGIPLIGTDASSDETGAPYHRFSSVTWMRLPQVSFSMVMVEPVTAVGGMVNTAPRALIRS